MSIHPIGPWTETIDATTSSTVKFGGCLIEANPLNSWGSGSYVPGTFIPYQIGVNYRGSYSHKSGVNNGGGTHIDPSPCITELRNSGPLVQFTCTLLGDKAVHWYLDGTKLSCHGLIEPVLYNDHVAGYDDDVVTATNKAYLKLAKKLSGAIAEGGVITGELRESQRTVKHATELVLSKTNNLTQSLSRAYKNIRGGHYSLVVNEVSDAFLEYQFGVKPMITDIGHVIEGVAQLGNNSSNYRKLSGTFVVDRLSTETVHNQFNWPFIYISRKSTRKSLVIVKMGGTLDTRKPPSEVNPDYQKFGLDLHNLAPTVYNLWPYTWLNDYFNNLSDFVNAIAFRRGVISNGWTVTIVKTVARHVYSTQDNDGWIVSGFKATPGTSENFYFNRSPSNIDGFIPTFEVRTPTLGQVANIFALGASKISAVRIRHEKHDNPRLSPTQLESFVDLVRHRIIR
jgi:hypothetical protein